MSAPQDRPSTALAVVVAVATFLAILAVNGEVREHVEPVNKQNGATLQ